jgi:hypothetical protein
MFQVPKYGHIGAHCKAQENCGYCAEAHSTKGCQERERPGYSRSLNCFKNHPSWSFQCQYRKEESAMIEEWRRNMPRTHKNPMGQHHREINPHQGCHGNQKEERQTQSTRRATNKQRSGKSEKGKVSKKVPKNMHEPRTRRHHMKSPPGAGSEHTPRARKPRYSSQ